LKHKLEYINSELKNIRKYNLYRKMYDSKIAGAYITINSKTLINLCSKDYLGIAQPKISNKQEFAKHDRGYPDGSTVDSEGGLWSCRWGGSCVIRFDPNGKVDEIVEVPVESVTCCTFGGENLDTLFITTARWGMTQEQIDNNPSAGGLFSIKPGVIGLADNQFGG